MDDAHQVSKCLLKCPQGNSFDFSTIFSEFEVDSIVSFPLGPNWSDSYVLSTFSSWVINHVLLPFKWKKMQICCLSSCRSTCCRAVETWEALADIFSQEKNEVVGCYLEKWYLNLCCFLFRVLNFQLADAIHAKVVWVVHMGCILHQSYYWKTEGNTKDIYKCHTFSPILIPVTL